MTIFTLLSHSTSIPTIYLQTLGFVADNFHNIRQFPPFSSPSIFNDPVTLEFEDHAYCVLL